MYDGDGKGPGAGGQGNRVRGGRETHADYGPLCTTLDVSLTLVSVTAAL